MREKFRKASLRRPAILLVLVIVSAVILTVFWNVVLASDYRRLREIFGAPFHITFIVVGSGLFLAIIVLTTMLGVQLFANLRWRQRQSNFLALVSHELNSPLSSIKLFAQTLRKNDLPPEEREGFASKILFDTDRLTHIVANLLRAAEVDRKGEELTVSPAEVDLHALLQEYVEHARAVLGDKVELELHGDETWVEVDPILFRQVLDNLVDNAIRYRGKGPARVALRVGRSDGWVELEVADRGIGIPAERLESIFERFYRIEERHARTGARGMGIGLNVVKSIVLSHGGEVTARSEGPGHGTTIRIRLPAVEHAVAP